VFCQDLKGRSSVFVGHTGTTVPASCVFGSSFFSFSSAVSVRVAGVCVWGGGGLAADVVIETREGGAAG